MKVSIEGQGHFLTLYFPGFVRIVLIRDPDIRTIGPLVCQSNPTYIQIICQVWKEKTMNVTACRVTLLTLSSSSAKSKCNGSFRLKKNPLSGN